MVSAASSARIRESTSAISRSLRIFRTWTFLSPSSISSNTSASRFWISMYLREQLIALGFGCCLDHISNLCGL